jgi:cation diffusion facilitator CzcD-associated flavoprotein CzcO
MRFQYAIVGFGPAGMFVLSLLPQDVISETLILDPTFLGGDLATEYGCVNANITKVDIVNTFQKIPRWSAISYTFLDKYMDTDCPKLADVCAQMRECVKQDVQKAHIHSGFMTELRPLNGGWQLYSEKNVWEAQKVVLCTGAKPKLLDLPIPHIPLPLALCKQRIGELIHSTAQVVVFGTAHSGTLVLKNLKELGCTNVTAVYKGTTPFSYARDGNPRGIKQEAATIADEIVSKKWGEYTPTFLSYYDFPAVFRATYSADFAVYSLGFESRHPYCITKEGEVYMISHNSNTGELEGLPNVWGFGIAFPTHDVGFRSFYEAIRSSSLFPIAPHVPANI